MATLDVYGVYFWNSELRLLHYILDIMYIPIVKGVGNKKNVFSNEDKKYYNFLNLWKAETCLLSSSVVTLL